MDRRMDLEFHLEVDLKAHRPPGGSTMASPTTEHIGQPCHMDALSGLSATPRLGAPPQTRPLNPTPPHGCSTHAQSCRPHDLGTLAAPQNLNPQ